MSKGKHKKYKAILIDFDGSLSPVGHVLSSRLRRALGEAKKKVIVSLATGRCFQGRIQRLLDELKLPGPHILWGGGAIFDWSTHKNIWQAIVPSDLVHQTIQLARQRKFEFIVDENFNSYSVDGKQDVRYAGPGVNFEDVDDLPNKVVIKMVIFTDSLKSADSLEKDLGKSFPELRIVKWVHADIYGSHRYGIDITKSSKLEAVNQYLKITKVKRTELIAVGDGYNDYPLLMAAGFKVAMGNAVPEVKAIADYIAPPVDKDGVAHVLEKFVLK